MFFRLGGSCEKLPLFCYEDFQTDLINLTYVYACWVSPRGNGLKALVKIADTKKHREHFTALQEELNCDKSGINESRIS